MISGLLNSRKYVFYDGGLGTMLQKNGLGRGERSDLMNMRAPEVVLSIQRAYAESGSDIICSNSFSTCDGGLEGSGYTPEQVVSASVDIAKRAGGGRTLTALDIGPIGEFIEPYGELSFEEAYDRFKAHALAGEAAGADLAAVETMSDPQEVRAAVTAVLENTSLPVFATMTFDRTGRTFFGYPIEEFAKLAKELGCAAAGMNCSYAPADMLEAAKRFADACELPIIIKLNAGLPDAQGQHAVGPELFAEQMEPYKDLGVKIVGGCCGTTPDHIRALRKAFSD